VRKVTKGRLKERYERKVYESRKEIERMVKKQQRTAENGAILTK